MDQRADSHSDMAQARQSDGINVIFDQKSPGSRHSRSGSSSSNSSTGSSRSCGSGYYRGHGNDRERHRSSSSSSSATSSISTSFSRSRSRSHPRCHRRSSRCRCDGHPRYRSDNRYCSPQRHYRAHSRSYSRSRTPNRYSHRYYRSRSRSHSRSVSRWSGNRRQEKQFIVRFSRSPSTSYRGRSRSRSRSRSYGRSVNLSLHDKKKLLETAKTNAMKILGVEKLELPESVKPILSEQSESQQLSPEPVRRVRQDSERSASQIT